MMACETPDGPDKPHKPDPPLAAHNRFDWVVTECNYVDADRLWRTVVVKHKISKIVYFPFKQIILSKVDLNRV
jgi:hypothetical protein